MKHDHTEQPEPAKNERSWFPTGIANFKPASVAAALVLIMQQVDAAKDELRKLGT